MGVARGEGSGRVSHVKYISQADGEMEARALTHHDVLTAKLTTGLMEATSPHVLCGTGQGAPT